MFPYYDQKDGIAEMSVKKDGNIKLTTFTGIHEMLTEYAINELFEINVKNRVISKILGMY